MCEMAGWRRGNVPGIPQGAPSYIQQPWCTGKPL